MSEHHEPSLNDILAQRGFTTRPAKFQGMKDILQDGECVFTGDAGAVTAWLKEQQK